MDESCESDSESCTGSSSDSASLDLDFDGEPQYSGPNDEDGKPHGYGTLVFPSGDSFRGYFIHGQKSGEGCYYFKDGSTLSGIYTDDALNGEAAYTYPDGGRLEGHYINDVLSGPAKEFNSDGELIFDGQYQDDIKVGICWIITIGNGCVVGEVDDEGAMSGSNIAYIYPDRKMALVGDFQQGVMKKAKLCKVIKIENKIAEFEIPESDQTYTFDVSTQDRISNNPLLPDPYEQEKVYVKRSNISNANEGLFALTDLPGNLVVAFYNGIRTTHKAVDARDWSENNNTISLDAECVIDVPPQYTILDVYRASLGHKANHSFNPKSKYCLADHPRFGQIKGVLTLQPIKKDEEITVSYGYDPNSPDDAPLWYKEKLQEHQNLKVAHF